MTKILKQAFKNSTFLFFLLGYHWSCVAKEEDMTIQYYNVYVSDSITPRAKIIQFFSNRKGRLLFRRVTVEGNLILPQYSEILMPKKDAVFSLRPFYTEDNPQIDTLKTLRFLLKSDTCIRFDSYHTRFNKSLMYYQQLPIFDATDICSELCFDAKQGDTIIFNNQKIIEYGAIPAKSHYDSNYILLKEVGLEYEYYKIQSYIPLPSDRIIHIADSIKQNGFKWFPQEPCPAEIPKTPPK